MQLALIQPQLLEWRAQGYTVARLEYTTDTNLDLIHTDWRFWKSEGEPDDWYGESPPVEDYLRAELEADLERNPPPRDGDLHDYEGSLWIDLEKQEIEHEYLATYQVYGDAKLDRRALS